MKFKAKYLGIESGGKPIVTLSKEDAEELGVMGGERVTLSYGKYEMTAIANIVTKSVHRGIVGIYDEVWKSWKVKEGHVIDIEAAKFPTSLLHIRDKLKRRKLNFKDVSEIIDDVVSGKLSEAEIAAFTTALYEQGVDIDEATSLSLAMVNSGRKVEFLKKPVCDKHSIGGVPGDKTTLLVVPIIAAAGLTIPKTSSRAITSAAGSADRAEVLMPVDLSVEEIVRTVEKTNGCMVWGGSLHLAPADDIFIQIEYPLSIDPMLLPSIMSKKKAVGADILTIDIPTGRGTKIKTIGDADLLAKEFIELGRRLGIKTHCVVTFGEQPVGHAIGPSLEAREALMTLEGLNVPDLIDKASHLAGSILNMAGKGGQKEALDILKSGKAAKKLREIIYAQGGDSEIKAGDIPVGEYGMEVESHKSGSMLWVDNHALVEVARAAGSPKDKGAGLTIHKKIGDPVKKGEKVLTIHAEKAQKLERARKAMDGKELFGVGNRMEMLIHEVKDYPIHRKSFMLDR
jgi:AMP phosphorylase